MSDNPVIDLKQSTVSAFLKRLGELTEAIVASNKHYLSMEESLGERMGRLERNLGERMERLEHTIAATRSELIAQNNQIITLQHDVLGLLRKDEG